MALRKRSSLPPSHARPGHNRLRFESGRRPERLVGIGFRCWLAGYDTGDIACWETGWNYYAAELGAKPAKTMVGELSCWVRALRLAACRRLHYYPFGCAGFCRDECLAISMIAASQHRACPALSACAFALMGAVPCERVLGHAADFADALDAAGLRLDDGTLAQAALLWRADDDAKPN